MVQGDDPEGVAFDMRSIGDEERLEPMLREISSGERRK